MSGIRKKPGGGRLRAIAHLLIAAVVLPLAFVLVGGGSASADPSSRLREYMVPAPGGVGQIKVRVWGANNGSGKAVYLLDGIRATDDVSGWEHETNAAWLSDHGLNVVEPVGGQSSFYADWYSPSNTNGQPYTYKWETFLTQNLPTFLAGQGIDRSGNAIVGLSMGGNAALALAAHHRNQFSFAGSLSGYLNLSAPGMPTAIRMAMLDAGRYNSDNMFGPPSDPAWQRHDPTVLAPQLSGLPMWIYSAAGVPGPHDMPKSATDVVNTANAMGLEALALAQARSFQEELSAIGGDKNVHYEFPLQGTHSWGYWQDQLWAMLPMMKSSIGAA